MKVPLLKIFPILVTMISCTKKSDQLNQIAPAKNQHFVGEIIDFSTNTPISGSNVYLNRVTGYHPNPNTNTFIAWNLLFDTTASNVNGSYRFTFLNNYEQNFYSLCAKKPGYIFIGPGFTLERDSIYKSIDTITNNLYLDKASQLRIHIKDVAPFRLPNDSFDIYRECKDPLTGIKHFADLKTFRASIDTVIVDEFSYKWSPYVKISWQVRANSSTISAVIIPNNITEFGTTDIEINY